MANSLSPHLHGREGERERAAVNTASNLSRRPGYCWVMLPSGSERHGVERVVCGGVSRDEHSLFKPGGGTLVL